MRFLSNSSDAQYDAGTLNALQPLNSTEQRNGTLSDAQRWWKKPGMNLVVSRFNHRLDHRLHDSQQTAMVQENLEQT